MHDNDNAVMLVFDLEDEGQECSQRGCAPAVIENAHAAPLLRGCEGFDAIGVVVLNVISATPADMKIELDLFTLSANTPCAYVAFDARPDLFGDSDVAEEGGGSHPPCQVAGQGLSDSVEARAGQTRHRIVTHNKDGIAATDISLDSHISGCSGLIVREVERYLK